MNTSSFGKSFGKYSEDSTGSNVLTITVVVGSVLLLLAALAGPMPVSSQPVAEVAKPAIEQVVVTVARPHHVS